MKSHVKIAIVLVASVVATSIPAGCAGPRAIDKTSLDAKIKRKEIKG